MNVFAGEADGYRLEWAMAQDELTLRRDGDPRVVWRGSLLPLFWLRLADGTYVCRKATVSHVTADLELRLDVGDVGRGTARLVWEGTDVRLEQLSVEWTTDQPPAIHSMYFGAAPLTDAQRTIVPSLELPFWPAWSAGNFCVPSAKGAPVQSFFRCWDFGHATLPLGSFGPSLGTPYAAAYPRPFYAAAMGDDAGGWVAFGPGEVPDAAVQLQVRSTTAMLQWLYREDLWGPGPASRAWDRPLRLRVGPTALDAYAALFDTFDLPPARPGDHTRSSINSWGSFKTGDFDLRAIADRAASLDVKLVVIDEYWETTDGTGEPAFGRFPHFDDDIAYIRSKGMDVGFWQSVGWIDDPAAVGLSDEDLIRGVDGRPRRANWVMGPHMTGATHFALDPSSPRVRTFVRERTHRIMRRFRPGLLKLDFAYGLPGPDVGAPRDPALRGERMGFELLRLIADAAREVAPAVTIQYYGLHPLMRRVSDLVALDDLGDAGAWEREGHAEWSIWSTLAGRVGTPVMSSSGYDWDADADVLLDTAVIGAPGCVLPFNVDEKRTMTPRRLRQRQAISRWHRRSSRWTPLWLDSEPGRASSPPRLRSWGRLESIAGRPELTALALRDGTDPAALDAAHGVVGFTGSWAILSQDDAPIRVAATVACIPFGDGGELALQVDREPTRVVVVTDAGERDATDDEAIVRGREVRIRLKNPNGATLGVLIDHD